MKRLWLPLVYGTSLNEIITVDVEIHKLQK
jgi:hypothetical protein